ILEIDGRLAELPNWITDRLVRQINPKPQVTVGNGMETDSEAVALRSELVELIEKDVDLGQVGIPVSISVSTFLRVWLTLDESIADMLEAIKAVIPRIRRNRELAHRHAAIVEDILNTIRLSEEKIALVLGVLFFGIDEAVNKRLLLCERAYWYDQD